VAKLDRMIRTHDNENRIVVGITQGDMNGIGYEVIIKALLDPRLFELFTPVVYGSSKVASYHRKGLNINDFSFNLIKKADQANPKRPNIINVHDKDIKIDIGLSTPEAGELSLLALEAAIEDLRTKQIDVLVTAPINKKNIQSDTFHFTGHTEYLAEKFGVSDVLMLMVSDQTRIGVVTGHIPLSEVSKVITEDLILHKLKIMNESLKKDFGIRKPRIAVLGLNPHAGDEGLIGMEEKTVITPAVEKAFTSGILAFGPFPADGFFGSDNYTKFDGILAMYHDQGLIPFKTIAFESGVNFTAGLPVVRTSPAHGTAYDIAGKDMASPDSLRAAMYLACDIFNNRMMHDELNSNPLVLSKFEAEK
jgi:4-hydroxythreonine-4-phosphate dehydrogenase